MDRKDHVNSLNKMRKGMKASDDLEMPMSDEFFERLHDKIMMEVELIEMAPGPVLMRSRNLLRSHWRGWLYPVGGISSLVLIASVLMTQVSRVNESMQRIGLLSDGRERIVAEALLSPGDLAQTLISSQTETDFFMDVAGESFENLTVAKFNKIMGESAR